MSEGEIIQSPRENATTPSKMHSTQAKAQRSYATVAATKPAQTPSQPWTKVNYSNRKIKAQAASPTEQSGRRILFPRKSGRQLKSEADLMLALNKALQKAGVERKVRFSRVRYAPSGSISALLIEKADATMLFPQRSNLLIQAAKSVDDAVVGVEILETMATPESSWNVIGKILGAGKIRVVKKRSWVFNGYLIENYATLAH